MIAAVALLIAALAPAHRRSMTPWHPGADLSVDRDHQRVIEELTAVAQRQVRGPRRVARLLGSPARPCRSTGRAPSHSHCGAQALSVLANASKASYVVSPTTIVVTSGVVRTSDLVRSSGLTYRTQDSSPTRLLPSTSPRG